MAGNAVKTRLKVRDLHLTDPANDKNDLNVRIYRAGDNLMLTDGTRTVTLAAIASAPVVIPVGNAPGGENLHLECRIYTTRADFNADAVLNWISGSLPAATVDTAVSQTGVYVWSGIEMDSFPSTGAPLTFAGLPCHIEVSVETGPLYVLHRWNTTTVDGEWNLLIV